MQLNKQPSIVALQVSDLIESLTLETKSLQGAGAVLLKGQVDSKKSCLPSAAVCLVMLADTLPSQSNSVLP